MGKFWQGKKLANLENHELFAKPIFTDTPKLYLAYALTYLICQNFPCHLPIALTCMVHQNLPPPKFSHARYLYLYLYLYLNTSKSTCILLKYFSQNNAMYLYLYFTKCQSTCTLIKYFHMYFAPCLATMNHKCTIDFPSMFYCEL